jgi:hypothetical protein
MEIQRKFAVPKQMIGRIVDVNVATEPNVSKGAEKTKRILP